MNIEKATYIDFSDYEASCLKKAEEIVQALYNTFEGKKEMYSMTTGECIEFSELSRTLGIIDGLIESRGWHID